MKQTLWVLALLMSACCMSLTGCKPSLPDDVLSQGKMEDILYDYHLALAMVQNAGGDETQRFIYKDAVLRKHDVTSAEFDSSMVYYMRHTDKMYTIYKNLSDRLNDEAVSLGADASDQSRFGDLASSGDTTNIWRGAQSLVFMTAKPLNYYNFEVKADTSFHKGDCIMLDFESHFIYQDGIRDGLAVLAVQFSNDSIASQVVHVQSSQHYSMQVEDRDTLGIKSVKGFFLLNSGDFSNDFSSATTLKLMFLDHIRMIKMHKKPVQPVNVSSGDADRFDKDSMGKPGVNTPAEAVKPADESVSPKTVSRKADMPLKPTPAVNRKLIAPRELKKNREGGCQGYQIGSRSNVSLSNGSERMKRYAAHQIVLEDGTAIEQGIVELSDGGVVARTFPFWHEQPMTEWLGGVIEVKADEAGRLRAYHHGHRLGV